MPLPYDTMKYRAVPYGTLVEYRTVMFCQKWIFDIFKIDFMLSVLRYVRSTNTCKTMQCNVIYDTVRVTVRYRTVPNVHMFQLILPQCTGTVPYRIVPNE